MFVKRLATCLVVFLSFLSSVTAPMPTGLLATIRKSSSTFLRSAS